MTNHVRTSKAKYFQATGIRVWLYMAMKSKYWNSHVQVSGGEMTTFRKNTGLDLSSSNLTRHQLLVHVISQYYLLYDSGTALDDTLKFKILETVRS